ncbi:long-chain fatty acid--CoA ligase [uncultured Duncaniella sp.]|uniref:AMP-dependent synthetase/ligase n=1 Tax=uncultured Duncaniella sp. TaxID=2768039 RepID=UPI0025F843CA|nr:long-chain fatty acid--CoA ligase [uncultured Duncaniella sp.]
MTDNILTLLSSRHASQRPDAPALAGQDEQERWYDISWREFDRQINMAARALASLGVKPADCVGTFSANRPENLVTDFACYRNRAISVSIYATSSPEQVAYIVNDASIAVLFAGNSTQYHFAREAMRQCPSLKQIIVIKPIETDEDDDTTMLWSDFIKLGEDSDRSIADEVEKRTAEARPTDIATLVYTSGTTGEPKGAMLTHANYDAALDAHRTALSMLSTDDVSMAFLPLSHIFEKGFTYVCLMMGIKVAVNRDPRAIQDTIKEVRPTCMCAVPRFWEKVYTAVLDKIASMNPVSRAMVRAALRIGHRRNLDYVRHGLKAPFWLERSYRFVDRRIFSKLRGAIGIDRPNIFPTAGAPVSPEIVEFFHSAGLWIMVGYGLSETTATVTCFRQIDYEIGSVGQPLPTVNIKIGDNSEVLVKGPTVMTGYYNKPEATAEAFTADGWFRTGDAGYIDKEGSLFLTDRIKDLFKTSNGKYIAPQMIEARLGTDKFIEQVAIIGDSRKFVSALIVPNFGSLREWAANNGIPSTSDEELLKHQSVHDMMEARLEKLQKGLAPYEKIKRFTLLPHEFTMDNGELTNTLKIKRRVINSRYADLIEAMYS